jgi:hypothetical protein
MKPIQLATAILAVIFTLSACRPPHPRSSGLTFGDGDTILKPVLDAALTGYDTQFAEISWSGGGGSGEFEVDDSLIVKKTDVATVAAKLFAELNKLPAKRGWNSHGSGIGGDSHLKISYEENGAQFYFDFVLTQKEQDVEILILHKGVQR